MKKIIIGGAFLFGGYWLIKNFLNKGLSDVQKPELDFKPKDTELLGTLEDGTEIRWKLEDRQLAYEKLRDLEDKGIYSQTLFRDDFTGENTKGLANSELFKNLLNIKTYSIDYTAINNLGKAGTLDLGFPRPEEMSLAIDKYKTGTPTQPTWSK